MTDQVSWTASHTACGGATGWSFEIFRRHRAADAEDADALHVAEIVLDLFQRRRGLEDELRCPSRSTVMASGFAGARADDALHVGEVVDRVAVDGDDQVAGLEAGFRGRAVRLHRIDPRAHGLLAVEHEDAGKNHDGQDEIRQRPGDDDGRALGHRLEHEALRALLRIHGGEPRGIGHARRVLVAEELHKAAERNRRDFPARSVAVIEADDFRPKADRKHQDPHAAPAGDQEMAQFVKEHDQAEHEQKGNDIATTPPPSACRCAKKYVPMTLVYPTPDDPTHF